MTTPAGRAPQPLITVGSPPNARTLPSGERWYRWWDQEYMSVTTVRDMAGLPYRLHQWHMSKLLESAVANAPDVLQAQVIPVQLERDAALIAIKARIRQQALSERDNAAKLGSAVHRAAEGRLDPATVPADVAPRLRAYHDWLQVSGGVVVASEFQVWNLTEGYAGTGDLMVQFPGGGVWLVDIKTGRSVYGEHALQVTAYAMAEFVGRDNVVDDDATAWLDAVEGLGILHLADDGWTFHVVRFDEPTWTAFTGLLEFAKWARLHDRIEDVSLAARQHKVAQTA